MPNLLSANENLMSSSLKAEFEAIFPLLKSKAHYSGNFSVFFLFLLTNLVYG